MLLPLPPGCLPHRMPVLRRLGHRCRRLRPKPSPVLLLPARHRRYIPPGPSRHIIVVRAIPFIAGIPQRCRQCRPRLFIRPTIRWSPPYPRMLPQRILPGGKEMPIKVRMGGGVVIDRRRTGAEIAETMSLTVPTPGLIRSTIVPALSPTGLSRWLFSLDHL